MLMIGILLILIGGAAFLFAFYNLHYPKVGERIALTGLFGGVIIFILGIVILATTATARRDTERCQKLLAQNKDVLLVEGVCWVNVGNGVYIQNGSKRTEVKTREELTGKGF